MNTTEACYPGGVHVKEYSDRFQLKAQMQTEMSSFKEFSSCRQVIVVKNHWNDFVFADQHVTLSMDVLSCHLGIERKNPTVILILLYLRWNQHVTL